MPQLANTSQGLILPFVRYTLSYVLDKQNSMLNYTDFELWTKILLNKGYIEHMYL